MIIATKCIKIQTRVWKKLVKTRKLYGFKSLSETIDMLIGHLNVGILLKEQTPTILDEKGEQDVSKCIETKDLH